MNKQRVTKESKSEQKELVLANLTGKDLAAIQKRYEGKPYALIARELESEFGGYPVKQESLRKLFMSGGRLSPAYLIYVQHKNEQRMQVAKLVFSSFILDAVGVIGRALRTPNHPQSFRAALTVVKRCWGNGPAPPVSQSSNEESPDPYARLLVAELEKRVERLVKRLKESGLKNLEE